jgi:hypothetical protein
LTWYGRDGDALVGEVDLRSIPLAQLRRWFGLRPSNPMADSFPVKAKQAEQLRAALGRPIHLDRYSYFVECAAPAKNERRAAAQRAIKIGINPSNGGRLLRAAG